MYECLWSESYSTDQLGFKYCIAGFLYNYFLVGNWSVRSILLIYPKVGAASTINHFDFLRILGECSIKMRELRLTFCSRLAASIFMIVAILANFNHIFQLLNVLPWRVSTSLNHFLLIFILLKCNLLNPPLILQQVVDIASPLFPLISVHTFFVRNYTAM